ncbi:MAG: DNA-directed RNA polymerase subunit beta [Christensenellales bacterium]
MQDKPKVKKVNYGRAERYSFAKVDENAELPYLLQIQKEPYKRFLDEGIKEVLEEVSPIVDYSDKAELYFLEHKLEPNTKHSEDDCRKSRLSYTQPLKVKARLVLKESGEVIDQEVYLGDIPIMSDEGYFIANGVEKVVISQIVKSPSVYFSSEYDKTGKQLIVANLFSPRGTRLSIDLTPQETLRFIINASSKVSAGVFLKACGLTKEEILKIFDNHPFLVNTLEKEPQETEEESLIEIAKKTRPSEVPSAEATRQYLHDTFFSNLYYNFSRVGRYKYNIKLSLASRIAGFVSAYDIQVNGETLVKKGEVIEKEVAYKIQDSGINEVYILHEGRPHKIIGNGRVKLSNVFPCIEEDLGINELVYYPLLKRILEENKTKEKRMLAIKQNAKELITTHLTIEDLLGTISYIIDLSSGLGRVDNIDHLENRRIATVGELMCNEFRKGVNKLKDSVRESMQSHDLSEMTPNTLVSARFVNKFLKDFLSSSQLCQFAEDFNPVTTLTNKRRISAVGPGGIKKERAGAEVRDVHYSHYGRICAIETPEGNGIGLINGLAAYAKVNEYGFIETGYRKVDHETGKVSNEITYMMAGEEEKYYICQAVEPTDEEGRLTNDKILCRRKGILYELSPKQVDYMDISPRQFISAITSLIPFLENDDTVRALTGSNMQRQAVPLLRADSPIIGTGIEHRIAVDSGAMVINQEDGVVSYVDGNEIIVKQNSGENKVYTLKKFRKTNKETCFNQKPIVKKGEVVKKGDVLADGFSTNNGELALGKNVTIAFMNWEGYNYEDAILISEKLVKEDTFTSITLKEEECAARSTKLGDEEITRDIPNVSEEMLRNLDENGIVRIGSEVRSGDYLVGKVTPKGETELTPEERLLRAIFGEKAREVRDNSLKVPHGSGGIVVDVQVFSRKNKDELDPGVNTLVKVFIAKKRKISVGDKMAGRHGNKGVVSRVLPEADMPYMANGEPVDIVLNPLGVPSRMNIGQILEVHLGLIAKTLGWKVATPNFNGATEKDIQEMLVENKLPEDGKFQLYDGRTGEPFENRVTVGTMYMIKLEHMSETKVHARSIGSYTMITRQPLGGKAMFGGQRFGEMEVWALEAYGASHLLQEMLTVKSDDYLGRQKAYESIVKGEPIPEPGIPEGFKVLVKELQSIGLDVKILTENNKEINVNEISTTEATNAIQKNVEEELKEIDIDEDVFNLSNIEENQAVTEEDVFDEDSLFDDFGDDE